MLKTGVKRLVVLVCVCSPCDALSGMGSLGTGITPVHGQR